MASATYYGKKEFFVDLFLIETQRQKMNIKWSSRFKDRSVGLLTHYFQTRYRFSPALAEALSADFLRLFRLFNPDRLEEGQVIYHVVARKEPSGKSLKDCEFVPVRLTLYHPEDSEFKKKNGLKKLKLRIIKRITREAVQQGGSLSQEDIAELLFLDRRTVVEYIKEIEAEGEKVITRAKLSLLFFHQSPKFKIIKMFLNGYNGAEIASSCGYPETYIASHIDSFLRVSLFYRRGFAPFQIAQSTGIELNSVNKHIENYNRVMADEKLSQPARKIFSFYEGPEVVALLKSKNNFYGMW